MKIKRDSIGDLKSMELFYDTIAEWYDHLWHKDFLAESSFYYSTILSHFRKDAHKVLDLACNTGTLGIMMAKKGFNVTGIDISQRMLDVASSKAISEGAMCDFRQGDITRFSYDECFDIAYCNSVHFLAKIQAVQNFFQSVARHLKPEGLLIINAPEPPSIEEIATFPEKGYTVAGCHKWDNGLIYKLSHNILADDHVTINAHRICIGFKPKEFVVDMYCSLRFHDSKEIIDWSYGLFEPIRIIRDYGKMQQPNKMHLVQIVLQKRD